MASTVASKLDLLALASDPNATPFDYIVVGSGAGGGVLAARLARSGRRVLVLEAGADVATDRQGCGPVDATTQSEAKLRLAYEVPAYWVAATEDPEMSWGFSVRHFADTEEQRIDQKYDPARDPAETPNSQWPTGKGGIFYPRASGIGGCTTQHAMLTLKPNDLDWDRVAELTGDDSWRASSMAGYFALTEQVLYYAVYKSALRRALGKIAELWRALITFLNPSEQLDNGGHGTAGWQKTSFISPLLIITIAITDLTLIRVLIGAIWWILKKGGGLGAFIKSLFSLSVVQFLDPNYRRDWPATPDVALKFIPIGTDGMRRVGLREWLLKNAIDYPDNLTIVTCALATRIIFAPGKVGAGGDDCSAPRGEEGPRPVPRAIGVEVAEGKHLYQASLDSKSDAVSHGAPRRQLFARCEVILSGGAYNSPQLLMLSGIGDQEDLRKHGIDGLRDRDGNKIAEGIDLAGVGKNLQDRYEVGVIAQTKKPFRTLDGATLVPPMPGEQPDPGLQQWIDKGTGLYATNGGAIAFLARSGHHDGPEPDLFVVGVPAAFRGYYWGWSSQLLYPEQVPPGEPIDQRNIWTWVILKAYTHNQGSVKLRSASPFAQLDIDTDYFARDPATGFYTPGAEQDLAAVEAGVELVRDINGSISLMDREVSPGEAVTGAQIKNWIRHSAWGTQAHGTCRMGSDPWRPHPAGELRDQGAVLDSRFRVHGVERLRVVDASIFPEMPGYSVGTAVFMAAEKAAQTVLAISATYHEQLRAAEASAVRRRREAALTRPESKRRDGEIRTPSERLPEDAGLPGDTVGLALSGRGVRSAAHAVGVLQALVQRDKLRSVDFLSSVGDGGLVGSFLGRLFTRVARDAADKPAYVERVLANPTSLQLTWLRNQASHASGDIRDLRTSLAAVSNLITAQLSIAALLVVDFGVLRLVSSWGGLRHEFAVAGDKVVVSLSPSWVLVPLIFFGGVLPIWSAFWLSPPRRSLASYSGHSLALWLSLLCAAVGALLLPELVAPSAMAIVGLLLGFFYQELARWSLPAGIGAEAVGIIVRDRLTKALGTAWLSLLVAFGWVAIDSVARTPENIAWRSWWRLAHDADLKAVLGVVAAIVIATLPLLRGAAPTTSAAASRRRRASLVGIAVTLALICFVVLVIDMFVHAVFTHSTAVGLWMVVVAFVISVVVGRAVELLNLSSLLPVRAARVARIYLGASNPSRIYPVGAGRVAGEHVPDVDDDLAFAYYHPELLGGPIHLINAYVNETAEVASGRLGGQARGWSLCVGPAGVTVGKCFHGLWDGPPWGTILRGLPTEGNPNVFHPFRHRQTDTIPVETLKLSQWAAISGSSDAADAQDGGLPLPLIRALLNIRWGFWWDSGVSDLTRRGRYAPRLSQLLIDAASVPFRTQALLLDLWRGYFAGLSRRYWYVTDGGRFDATGAYELIRRQMPLIIASEPPHTLGQRDEVANLVHLAEADLGAKFQWLDPAPGRATGLTGWAAFEQNGVRVPGWIRQWLDPEGIGSRESGSKGGQFAGGMARVSYGDGSRVSWLLLLRASGKATPSRVESESDTTAIDTGADDEFLSTDEWEAYREFGERSMTSCLARGGSTFDESGRMA